MKALRTQTTAVNVFRLVGLPEPQAEYHFALPHRRFRFDFAWPGPDLAWKVALEKEGGLYGRGKACALCGRKPVGAHSSIKDMLKDIAKYNLANVLGWTIIRCTPQQLSSLAALADVRAALIARGWTP